MCDDGRDEYNGHIVHLNCVETDYDGGDCLREEAEILFDCLGQAFLASALGDGKCDDGKSAPYFIDLACEDYRFDAGDCVYDSQSAIHVAVLVCPKNPMNRVQLPPADCYPMLVLCVWAARRTSPSLVTARTAPGTAVSRP